jgi:hypothetical protein
MEVWSVQTWRATSDLGPHWLDLPSDLADTLSKNKANNLRFQPYSLPAAPPRRPQPVHYQFDFVKMTQENLQTGTVRPLRHMQVIKVNMELLTCQKRPRGITVSDGESPSETPGGEAAPTVQTPGHGEPTVQQDADTGMRIDEESQVPNP